MMGLNKKPDQAKRLDLIEHIFKSLTDIYHVPAGAAEASVIKGEAKKRVLLFIRQIQGIQDDENKKANGHQLIQVYLAQKCFRLKKEDINMLKRLSEDSLAFKTHIFHNRDFIINAFCEQGTIDGFSLLRYLEIPLPNNLAILAVKHNQLELLKWLVQEAVCQLDVSTSFRLNLLEKAVDNKNWGILCFLLKQDAIYSKSAFFAVLAKGDVDAIKIMLQLMVEKKENLSNYYDGDTGPIQLVMNLYLVFRTSNWIDILDLLINYSIKHTAAHPPTLNAKAAASETTNKTLLDLGINLASMPLKAQQLNFITEQILKRHPEVKIHAEDQEELNLLQQCAKNSNLVDTAKWLISEHGFDPEVKTASGNTILLLAAESKNFMLVRAFVKKEIKVSEKSEAERKSKKSKKSKSKPTALKKCFDIRAANHQGKHIGHYLLLAPTQIDLLLYLIKNNQIMILHEDQQGLTIIDTALALGEQYYPVVHACFSQIQSYKKQTQQDTRALFKDEIFLMHFLEFFEAYQTADGLSWIFEEQTIAHLIFSQFHLDEIPDYIELFDLDINQRNQQGETVLCYLIQQKQGLKAIAILSQLFDSAQQEDVFLILDFALSTDNMAAFELLSSKLSPKLYITYIQQLKNQALLKLLTETIEKDLVAEIAAEVFDEKEKKIAAAESAVVRESVDQIIETIEVLHESEQHALAEGMPLPLCYNRPDHEFALSLIRSLLKQAVFKDLQLYLSGSVLYKESYDIDILIPDVLDNCMDALVDQLIMQIQKIKNFGSIKIEKNTSGSFGYVCEKNGVKRRVIAFTLNDINIEFICVSRSLKAHAVGLDFRIGLNFFDLRTNTYVDEILEGTRTDLQAGIIDTIIDPMMSFSLDISRVFRALRIISSGDALQLSSRCHEAIKAQFASYPKGRTIQINSDKLHYHLQKIYSSGCQEKNVRLLMDYNIFPLLINTLNSTTNTYSRFHARALDRIKNKLDQSPALVHPQRLFQPAEEQAKPVILSSSGAHKNYCK